MIEIGGVHAMVLHKSCCVSHLFKGNVKVSKHRIRDRKIPLILFRYLLFLLRLTCEDITSDCAVRVRVREREKVGLALCMTKH